MLIVTENGRWCLKEDEIEKKKEKDEIEEEFPKFNSISSWYPSFLPEKFLKSLSQLFVIIEKITFVILVFFILILLPTCPPPFL